MKSNKLRKLFLDFFKDKEHTVVESSPLIPIGDASLLFTTAGMVQFKEQFATEDPDTLSYKRATSCQKCLRTSDLEIIGKTVRHHTFFEMLGNFSFGDYFKKESIEFAWDFSTKALKLPANRIYASVYIDDDEAYDLWHKYIGLPKNRIVRLGKKDNFWGPAGDVGPCGPCSELYFDLGSKMLDEKDGLSVGKDNDRYIEYWNLVFNQYNKVSSGEFNPLKFKGVDTGMGLERLTMISEGLTSVYETDLFSPIIKAISKISPHPYNKETQSVYNLIADHIRAVSFVMAENILPSNEGRGYVIRRLLRRAIRSARFIDILRPFLYELVDTVVATMPIYPDIANNKENIKRIIKSEENAFSSTLAEGSVYLDNLMMKLKDKDKNMIPGEEAFKLYDSMGFPLSLVEEIAKENAMLVNTNAYDKLMEEQRKRARSNWNKEESTLPSFLEKEKTAYKENISSIAEAKILYLLIKDSDATLKSMSEVGYDLENKANNIVVVTDMSIFYGESGGQVGDIGSISKNSSCIEINDTKKVNNLILHYGNIKSGKFSCGDVVNLSIDYSRKEAIARNHSATHILQKALQDIVGTHIRQLGSLVNEKKLRFDFSHFKALSAKEIVKIEDRVNKAILENVGSSIEHMEQRKALDKGALAFFGDKYGSLVRTVKLGNSFELCGGTHVKRTGDIGTFKIISESSISSGTRRIEAITGFGAMDLYKDLFYINKDISVLLNIKNPKDMSNKIKEIIDKNKSLEKELKLLSTKLSLSKVDELINKSLTKIDDINFVGLSLLNKDINELKKINDNIKSRYKNLITLLLSIKDEQVFYLSSVSKELTSKYKASDIIAKVSSLLDGRGGGRDEIAQGRGSNTKKVDEALKALKEKLSFNHTAL